MPGAAQARVFTLKSRQRDLSLKLRLPNKREASKSDDVSGSRLDIGRLIVWVATIETSKVGITIGIHLQGSGRSKDGTLVEGASQISNNHLDSSSMALLRVVAEASDLADCEGNVRTSIGRKTEHHPDNRPVVPFLSNRFTVWVNTESLS